MRHAAGRLLAPSNSHYTSTFGGPLTKSAETISANKPAAIDGLPARRRVWAATAIFAALAIASLDTAIANVALPAIRSDA
jgi:DHA2 family multidrug resistance protein-like MFS transporter